MCSKKHLGTGIVQN